MSGPRAKHNGKRSLNFPLLGIKKQNKTLGPCNNEALLIHNYMRHFRIFVIVAATHPGNRVDRDSNHRDTSGCNLVDSWPVLAVFSFMQINM